MEFRAWITVSDLPVTAEELWEPLAAHLESRYGDLGPVLGWRDSACEVVLALDADDEAAAAQRATDVIADSLHAVGLGDRYPAALEVEPTDPEPVLA